MAWTLRQGGERLVLFVDDLAGSVARMATYFTLPVDVRSVQGADSSSAEPDPLPYDLEAPARRGDLLRPSSTPPDSRS